MDQNDEAIKYIEQLEAELSHKNASIGGMNNAMQQNMNSGMNENLIVFQLEVQDLVERISHLLKGDIVKIDENGNTYYEAPEDDSLKTMNDYGVKMIMNTLEFYINRNTLLSHYDQTRIDKILFDLGNKIRMLIFINYEKMGLNTIEKQSRYPMIVINIIHTVESAYRRSLQGGERESLRSARVVTQSQPLGNNGMMSMGMGQSRRRGFNPFKVRSWMK